MPEDLEIIVNNCLGFDCNSR